MTTGLRLLFESFLKEKRYLVNLSERTLASYAEVFARYEKFSDASQIPTNELLLRFVVGMREHGLSVTTCNISIRSLNSFLSWLHEQGHIPALRLKKLKEEKRVMKTLDDRQIKAVLKWKPKSKTEHRTYALICLLLDTGARIDEALSLQTLNVNFDALTVTITGKGNRQRTVPIIIELRKILYRYVTKYRYSRFPTPLCFPSINGSKLRYSNAYRDVKAVLNACGIGKEDFDGFFHQWRRKFARGYVKNGGNVFYLQKVMGHSDLATTKVYVEADNDDLQTVHLATSLLSRLK